MPEGHSLELAARRLAPIVGSSVLEGPLAGSHVTGVEARGKHLLIHADDGRSVDLHLGMHGRARLLPSGAGPPRGAQPRGHAHLQPATPCWSAACKRRPLTARLRARP